MLGSKTLLARFKQVEQNQHQIWRGLGFQKQMFWKAEGISECPFGPGKNRPATFQR